MSAPLRVLHISSVYPPHVVGGAEKVVAQLAEAQAGRGMEVAAAYLTASPQPPGERNRVTTLPQASRNLIWMEDVMSRPRLERTANKLLQVVNIRAAADFASAMDGFRPDIVHTHSMVDLPPDIWRRAKAAGAQLVHTLHDYDLVCSRASLFRNGRNCVKRHLSCRIVGNWKGSFARHIDGVAAVSSLVLEEHRHHGLFADLPPERARVIWNAAPGIARGRVARRKRDASRLFTFGFLGRLVPEKGLHILLQACRRLPASGWRLQVAGRAPAGDAEFRTAAEGLPVEFLGFTDPQAFLSGIDVLVVPSIWREPFGLTVVEAFAAGVPVIGSDIGFIGESLASVTPEMLVPPEDETALAEKMATVLAAGPDALPHGDAFRPVLDAVEPRRMIDGYERLYAHLVSTPDRKAA